jgi:uncharacterized protein (TIGR02646 family)
VRSVQRSPEPGFFVEIRVAHTQWGDLDGANRSRIRDALKRDFGPVCAYCQQSCKTPTGRENPDSNEETIEHFRPRNKFPDQQFNWLNLLYACSRCNGHKSDSWPVDDDFVNNVLEHDYFQYLPVSEYVNPNEADDSRPAHEFFNFNFETGKMCPAEQLDDVEWSIAFRTIRDIDLNDEYSSLRDYDQRHLRFQRRVQWQMLERLTRQLDALGNSAARDQMLWTLALPGLPFSGFNTIYLKGRYPELFGQD